MTNPEEKSHCSETGFWKNQTQHYVLKESTQLINSTNVQHKVKFNGG
jgi:hypothetical protein